MKIMPTAEEKNRKKLFKKCFEGIYPKFVEDVVSIPQSRNFKKEEVATYESDEGEEKVEVELLINFKLQYSIAECLFGSGSAQESYKRTIRALNKVDPDEYASAFSEIDFLYGLKEQENYFLSAQVSATDMWFALSVPVLYLIDNIFFKLKAHEANSLTPDQLKSATEITRLSLELLGELNGGVGLEAKLSATAFKNLKASLHGMKGSLAPYLNQAEKQEKRSPGRPESIATKYRRDFAWVLNEIGFNSNMCGEQFYRLAKFHGVQTQSIAAERKNFGELFQKLGLKDNT